MKFKMNEKIKTICLILITVVILAGAGFYHYQKVERKYQACRNKCKLEKGALMSLELWKWTSHYQICIENCKEKYGKEKTETTTAERAKYLDYLARKYPK